jgi:hypothetical protein
LSNQTFHVYIGNGLTRQSEIHDTNEISRIGWFTPVEVAQMLRDNAIRDGLSLTALLWFFFDAAFGPPDDEEEL